MAIGSANPGRQCNVSWFFEQAPTLKFDSIFTSGTIWAKQAPVNFSNFLLLRNI